MNQRTSAVSYFCADLLLNGHKGLSLFLDVGNTYLSTVLGQLTHTHTHIDLPICPDDGERAISETP